MSYQYGKITEAERESIRARHKKKFRPNEQGDMVEDHGGNFTADRYEANRDFCDEQEERWSLLDEGRSDGQGESYAERNR